MYCGAITCNFWGILHRKIHTNYVHVIMSCHKLLALITMIRNVILHLVHMKFLIRSLILDLYLPLVRFLLHHHLLSVGVLSVKPPCLFCSKCYAPLNKPLSYVKNDCWDMLFLKTKYALKGDFVMVILTL